MVDPGAEIGHQPEAVAGLGEHPLVDAVGQGRNEDVGGLHRLHQLLARQGVIVVVEPRVEQLHHPRLDDIGELAGDEDEGFLSGHARPDRS